jgi:hypothetical protein
MRQPLHKVGNQTKAIRDVTRTIGPGSCFEEEHYDARSQDRGSRMNFDAPKSATESSLACASLDAVGEPEPCFELAVLVAAEWMQSIQQREGNRNRVIGNRGQSRLSPKRLHPECNAHT